MGGGGQREPISLAVRQQRGATAPEVPHGRDTSLPRVSGRDRGPVLQLSLGSKGRRKGASSESLRPQECGIDKFVRRNLKID